MQNDQLKLLRVGAGETLDAGEDNGSEAGYSICDTSLSFVTPAQGWMLADDSVLAQPPMGAEPGLRLRPVVAAGDPPLPPSCAQPRLNRGGSRPNPCRAPE